MYAMYSHVHNCFCRNAFTFAQCLLSIEFVFVFETFSFVQVQCICICTIFMEKLCVFCLKLQCTLHLHRFLFWIENLGPLFLNNKCILLCTNCWKDLFFLLLDFFVFSSLQCNRICTVFLSKDFFYWHIYFRCCDASASARLFVCLKCSCLKDQCFCICIVSFYQEKNQCSFVS